MEDIQGIVAELRSENKKLKKKLNEAQRISEHISEILTDLEFRMPDSTTILEIEPIKPRTSYVHSVKTIIRASCEKSGTGLAPIDEILDEAAKAGIDNDRTKKVLEKMKEAADLFEVRPGQYRLV